LNAYVGPATAALQPLEIAADIAADTMDGVIDASTGRTQASGLAWVVVTCSFEPFPDARHTAKVSGFSVVACEYVGRRRIDHR
jgi:hypothetical protein